MKSANVGAFVLGTSMGWTSPAQRQLQFNSTLSEENIWHFSLDDHQMSWVGSLVNLGALCGALMAGYLMNWIGRKGVLMVTTLPASLGWIIITLAMNPSKIQIYSKVRPLIK